MSKVLACVAAFFFLMGSPFLVGWLRGEYAIFWTGQGAALVQCFGSGTACLWGAWLFRGEK